MLKKRGFCIAAVFVLCLTLCGCDVEILPPSSESTQQTTSSASTSPVTTTTQTPQAEVPLTLLENGYAYSVLSETQKDNYATMVKQLYEQRGYDTTADGKPGLTVTIPHFLRSQEEVDELFYAVFDDHPEFFYLRSSYSWFQIGNFYTRLSFYYSGDAVERATRAAELEAAVSELLTQAQGLSDVQAELLFHDALTARNDYNTQAAHDNVAQSDAYFDASSPYAALCTGNPICGGYSRAFQLLLSRRGIQNTALSNEDHAWTMVWLDGEAYHVDVTWDDPTGGGEECHSYFNITDEEAIASREFPEQVRELPVATATAYNYYEINGWVFEDPYDEDLGPCIRAQIESGAERVELKFVSEDYKDVVACLFDDQLFFDIVYQLEEDALRDRWYAQMRYQGKDTLQDILIYPSE